MVILVAAPGLEVAAAGNASKSRAANSAMGPALVDTFGAEETGAPVAHGVGAASRVTIRRSAGRALEPGDGAPGAPGARGTSEAEAPAMRGWWAGRILLYLNLFRGNPAFFP